MVRANISKGYILVPLSSLNNSLKKREINLKSNSENVKRKILALKLVSINFCKYSFHSI